MQSVSFKNSRGLNLAGNFYDIGARKGIVIAHGFAGDKLGTGKYEKLAAKLNEAQFNVLAFDFSGCGESDDDTLTLEKHVDDLKVAIHFLKQEGSSSVGLVGYSLGGLVAAMVWDEDVRTLVLWAPVTSAKKEPRSSYSSEQLAELDRTGFITKIKDHGPRSKVIIDGKMLEERRNIRQKELLSRITAPVLIIHGDQDEKVPVESSRRAIQYLSPSSMLKVVAGGTHDLNQQMDKYIPVTVQWFLQHLR